MNISIHTIKSTLLAGFMSVFMFGALSMTPTPAHACIEALGFLDPFCVISGDADLPGLPSFNSDDAPQTVTNTYTNSNNINSNINSPGGVVGAPIAYQTPVYNYDTYYDYDYYDQGALRVSCYPQPLTIDEDERATWHANAYGGNGSYHYSWDGTDGLSGTGQSVSKRYNNTGYKNATVTVRSGSQTVSRNCDGSVHVRDDRNDRDYDYDHPYYYGNYYAPLSVSCSSPTSGTSVGGSVRWNAYAAGGNGSYRYTWTGTDGLGGSSQTIYRTYSIPGTKYAAVTVWSDGQSFTQNCSNAVTVGGYAPAYYPASGGLSIACYSDPRTVTVNQPATWITEVTGGAAPYSYVWTGTDDLTGNTSSVIKYYGTTGNKTAVITVTSADGRSESRACSTSVTVRAAGSAVTTPAAPADADDNGDLSAAALFSLKNVPWGWVAVLIILVLFATVIYLIYNRPKI